MTITIYQNNVWCTTRNGSKQAVCTGPPIDRYMDQPVLDGTQEKGSKYQPIQVMYQPIQVSVGRNLTPIDPNRVKFDPNDRIDHWRLFWGFKSSPSPSFHHSHAHLLSHSHSLSHTLHSRLWLKFLIGS